MPASITDLVNLNTAAGTAYPDGHPQIVVLYLASTDASGRHYTGWLEVTANGAVSYSPFTATATDGSSNVGLTVDSNSATSQMPDTAQNANLIASKQQAGQIAVAQPTPNGGFATVASVFALQAMTTNPDLVMVRSWDGTTKTKDGGGLFMFVSATADGVVSDGGIHFITATGAHYQRCDYAPVEPAYYGAVGDGLSHPASALFDTLGALQTLFPFAISLYQEMDFLAIQAACKNLDGIKSRRRNYYMLNENSGKLDQPLVMISGITNGSLGLSTLDFTAQTALTTDQHLLPNWDFSQGDTGQWINAGMYTPPYFSKTQFTTDGALSVGGGTGTWFWATFSNGTMTVTKWQTPGLPLIYVGMKLYFDSWTLPQDTVTVTAMGTGTGKTGTYTVSDSTISVTTPIICCAGTGSYMQFGQQITLQPGQYTARVKYQARTSKSYANGNINPGSVGISFASDGVGAGYNPIGSGVFVTFSSLPDEFEDQEDLFIVFGVSQVTTAWVDISVSGWADALFKSVDIQPGFNNCAILATRDGALEHYPQPARVGFWAMNGNANTALTGIRYNSYQSTDGQILCLDTVAVQSFGVGIDFQNGAYLAEFWECGLIGCSVAGIRFIPGLINAGENFRFYGGGFGNTKSIVLNPGGAEFTFHSTSLDYSYQIIGQNIGRIELHGCHVENFGPLDEGTPLMECRIGGAICWYGGMFLMAGSAQNYTTEPVWLTGSASVMEFNGTEIYQLKGPTGKAFSGAGQMKMNSILNRGNANIGTMNNATTDVLARAGFFTSQDTAILMTDNIGLIGGLYPINENGFKQIDQWTSSVSNVQRVKDYAYGTNTHSMRVQTAGGPNDDTVIVCIPIEKFQSCTISVQIMTPNPLSKLPENYDPDDNTTWPPIYFRAYTVKIIGYDQYSRPKFGGSTVFVGENDIRYNPKGSTEWVEYSLNPAYHGSSDFAEDYIATIGASSPAGADHIAILFDSESIEAVSYYIGVIAATVF